MKALASLIGEHHLIARLVGALETYTQRLKEELPVDSKDLTAFATVFTELADDIHHEKEESILLPLLSRHGFDWNAGVLAAVRTEHQQERYLIDVLSHVGERPTAWSNEDRRHIAATATALVDFQRHHHHLENTELFPEVAARLGDGALAQLQAELEAFDRGAVQQLTRARLEAIAGDLIERYPPASTSAQRLSPLASAAPIRP
jgi:hemerythrin-like domain-containing protein